MTLAARLTLLLTLTVLRVGVLTAQETQSTAKPTIATTTAATATTTAAPAPAATATAHDNEVDVDESMRRQFHALLRRQPSRVTTILVLEPSLLSNEPFVTSYPELARFVAEHPEVRSYAREYLSGLSIESDHDDPADVVASVGAIIAIAFAFLWLIRTIIDQRRLSRLSKAQTEVHNKILDRFSSSEELLQYIKSPAGSKFLESAPIPLHEDRSSPGPLSRVMWSIQLGVIVAFGGMGMLLVSLRLSRGASTAIFAMGAIAFCVGAGFIASAAVSVYISRRFGIGSAGDPMKNLENPELMR